MHVPDGFLDLPTSLATGAVAVGAIGLALNRSRRELGDAGVPLAGLTAVFVFAAQMVNFPVGAGTSGHLIGGALAAILVGPWTGVLCLSVVLLVQAVFFADGGLTALGTNITLLAVVGVVTGYLAARAVIGVLPRRRGSVTVAAFAGAALSVPAAALAFVGLYLAGGVVPIPTATLTTAMLGWHLLIGLGEGLVTGAVVSTVAATRPDLVHLLRHTRPAVHLLDGAGNPVPAGPEPQPEPVGRGLLAVAASVCLVVAGGLSLVASAHPDGLEFVAGALGFEAAARPSATAASPLADYGVAGLGAVPGGVLAGVAGLLLTALIVWLVLRASRAGARQTIDA